MKGFFQIVLALLATSVNATTLTLHCEGITRGPDIQDSRSSKVIELDLTSKKIIRVSPAPTACFIGKLQKKDAFLYEMSTDFACLSNVAESYLELSRYDFRLKEMTRFIGKNNGTDLIWSGEFVCSEKSKKF